MDQEANDLKPEFHGEAQAKAKAEWEAEQKMAQEWEKECAENEAYVAQLKAQGEWR